MKESWIRARLDEFANVIQGQSPPGTSYNSLGVGLPFFQGKAEFGELHPTVHKWCSEPAKIAEEGDILISVRAPVGPTNIAHVRCCIGRGLAAIQPAEQIQSRFLFYQLRHSAHRLEAQATGTTFKAISGKQLRAHRLVVAPTQEQRRIVEALETNLTRLEAAEAALNRARANLRRYRTSVLKAAVNGRLVPTEAELARREGRSYEPATKLLERILVERRHRWEETELAKRGPKRNLPETDDWKRRYQEPQGPDLATMPNPELPKGWSWATIDQLLYRIDAGKNFKCDEREPREDETGVVKVSSVSWGTFDEVESKTCTRPELVSTENLIHPGDFLFSRANTIDLVGTCVIVHSISKRLMLSDKILRLRLVGDMAHWLLWYLRSQRGRNEIESLATGNQESMRNISQAKIRQIRIPVPPASESRRIVGEIEHLLTTQEAFLAQVRVDLTRIGGLRQSILKWAFEGKLVDQDPNDEPAAVLLERIRTEREKRAAGRPRRRRARSRRRASAEQADDQGKILG